MGCVTLEVLRSATTHLTLMVPPGTRL
jgi:hypothetical protein